jgi:hypothetical protein
MSTSNDINNKELMTISPHCTNGSNQQALCQMNGEIDFEIVGMFSNSNGCFCCCHRVCGAHVVEGDIHYIKYELELLPTVCLTFYFKVGCPCLHASKK